MKTYKIYRVFQDGKSWFNIAYAIDGVIELIESYRGEVRDGFQYSNSIDFESNLTGASSEELNFLENLKVRCYREMIYSLYDNLYTSSLARALSKGGQSLSQSQLEKLKQGYEQKRNVAQQYLADSTIVNQTLFDTISFEESTDFVDNKLTNEVTYLNANYGANIPTENITRLQQYCYLIVVKYNLGSQYWEVLKAYCETFRSKLITNLDKLEFDKIDSKIALVLTITNDTTLAEIQALESQFNAL